jgi:signal transduction histidine kinase
VIARARRRRDWALALEAALFAAAVALLWLSSLSSYLLFHSVVEAAFIAVAVAVFVMAWNLRRVTENGYAVVMGTGLVFASALELTHMLAYKGMGVFPWAGADLPTQLWIAVRYLTAATFVVAPFFFARSPRVWLVSAIFALVVSALLASIFWLKIFPTCYVDPGGLTEFKKVSEYAIAAAFVAAAILVARRGRELSSSSRGLLVAAMLASAAAEISFTLYVGVYAFPNLLGHLLMFLSVYLVYRGIVTSGLARTYRQVVAELELRTAELEGLSRGLESRVEERTSELETAVAELETISYSVSHELRSPLRAIDGFSLIALEEGRGVLSPPTIDGLERSRTAAQHMGQLIDDLLELMRTGRRQPLRESVDLSAMAAETTEELRKSDPWRDVRVDIAPGMTAEADATLTRVLVHNLLANAWKFTSREEHAEISVWREDGDDGVARYCVRDNGVGLDDAHAGRLFEPFQRLVRKDEFPGTGVGLAIVQRAVHLHGGRVEIHGAPGQGATVWFTLAPALSGGGSACAESVGAEPGTME